MLLHVDMRNEIRRIMAGIRYLRHMTSQKYGAFRQHHHYEKCCGPGLRILRGLRHPADEFVADFIGESNSLHATIADSLLT